MMESRNEELIDSSSTRVYELPGETAIVIIGLPPLSSSDANLVPAPCAVADVRAPKFTGFREWLVGREVKKLFGEQFFSGQVTQFDEQMGWYRVEYEDGDFEDLEWLELEQVLVPLDVNIPLKSLARKIIKKRQKSVNQSAKSTVRTRKSGDHGGKGNEKRIGGS